MSFTIDRFYFRSKPRVSPFAPEWNYFLAESQIDNVNFDIIAKYFLMKENELLQLPVSIKKGVNDGYTGLGNDSLTSRYAHYNVFQFEDELTELKLLRKEIYDRYCALMYLLGVERKKVWFQSWCNIIRNGEQIQPHIHNVNRYCYLGAHVNVQCNNTSTIYINPINQINDPETYESINKVGKLTIFQQNIPHYTSIHQVDEERITIAFDFLIEEEYQLTNDENKKNLLLFDRGCAT